MTAMYDRDEMQPGEQRHRPMPSRLSQPTRYVVICSAFLIWRSPVARGTDHDFEAERTASDSAQRPIRFWCWDHSPGEDRALTASAVIDALVRGGFATPYPLETTAQECRVAGCEQSFVTDIFRVKSFATSAEAERYATPRNPTKRLRLLFRSLRSYRRRNARGIGRRL
jgi:hypothetical protein